MNRSMCVGRVLCLLLLAGSPALAFRGAGFGGGMHVGGFGAGMHGSGGRFGTASGLHGGFGATSHAPGFGGHFVTHPGVFHGGFDHFHGGFGRFPVHRGFDFRFHHFFPHRSVFFFGFGHPFFFPSSRIVIVNQPFFFPPFGFFVNAPFFCFPCGISFATQAVFLDHIHRFHHFHGIPPHVHVATGSHAVFLGA